MDDVLTRLHPDKELAALLVPKLKRGCQEWLNAQKLGNTGQVNPDAEGDEEQPGGEDFKHVSRGIVEAKIKQILAEL